MALELKVPAMGESITEVEIGDWLKAEGDSVRQDENIVVIESEKATVELPAPISGRIQKILKKKGQSALVGEVIAELDNDGSSPAQKQASTPENQEGPAPSATPPPPSRPAEPRIMPAARRVMAENQLSPEEVTPSGPGQRITKEDAVRSADKKKAPAMESSPSPSVPTPDAGGREEEMVPMSRLRRTITERLLQAQQNSVILTTMNEVDMSAIMSLRKEFGEAFLAKYKIKLGFMSFFVKACIDALKATPEINAEIRAHQIVYKNYYDIGVAIGGGKGLVVPVIRNADRLSFGELEGAIANFAVRARENKLKLEDLQGGTFTITNGGVYGSLLSTPLLNPPQSGILGMHSIQDRPVVRDGQIVIRPMMYLALSYDHRIVDGKEAVTFLKRIKDIIENPTRMLLEV